MNAECRPCCHELSLVNNKYAVHNGKGKSSSARGGVFLDRDVNSNRPIKHGGVFYLFFFRSPNGGAVLIGIRHKLKKIKILIPAQNFTSVQLEIT